MDIATLLGLALGAGCILFGMLSGGSPISFLNPASLAVTVGGGLASTIICYPLSDTLRVIKIFPLIFKLPEVNPYHTIQMLLKLSQKARHEGLIALESAQAEIRDGYVKKALELVVDGVEANMVKASMQLEIDSMAARHAKGQSYFRTMASQFPAWGMIGTLMGLVNLLRTLDNPAGIGPAMALAIVTIFYGVILANFVCTPIANKLQANSNEEIRIREMIMEGVLSIQAGENPRLLEHKLKTFLSPEQKTVYESMIRPDVESSDETNTTA